MWDEVSPDSRGRSLSSWHVARNISSEAVGARAPGGTVRETPVERRRWSGERRCIEGRQKEEQGKRCSDERAVIKRKLCCIEAGLKKADEGGFNWVQSQHRSRGPTRSLGPEGGGLTQTLASGHPPEHASPELARASADYRPPLFRARGSPGAERGVWISAHFFQRNQPPTRRPFTVILLSGLSASLSPPSER